MGRMRYIMIDTNYFVKNKFDTKRIILKDFKKMIEDKLGVFIYIEKEPNPILQDDLYSYQYNLDALNDSVSIEIENLKISIKEKEIPLEYLGDPTSVF